MIQGIIQLHESKMATIFKTALIIWHCIFVTFLAKILIAVELALCSQLAIYHVQSISWS